MRWRYGSTIDDSFGVWIEGDPYASDGAAMGWGMGGPRPGCFIDIEHDDGRSEWVDAWQFHKEVS